MMTTRGMGGAFVPPALRSTACSQGLTSVIRVNHHPTQLWTHHHHEGLRQRKRVITVMSGISPHISAQGLDPWSALVVSSVAGTLLEHKTEVGKAVTGSLIAFLLQAVFSNLHLAPSQCNAYEVCWSTVLPASLSLSVLLSIADQRASAEPSTSSKPSDGAQTRVAIAYAVGGLGSIFGAYLAFKLSSRFLWLPTPMAAKVASALAATYVGGSVNFFQVARAVGLYEEGTGVLGAIAAGDILTMAVYFALLLAVRRSGIVERWLLVGRREMGLGGTSGGVDVDRHGVVGSSAAVGSGSRGIALREVAGGVLGLVLSLAIGRSGQVLEGRLKLPGTSAAIVTTLSLAVYKALRRLSPVTFRTVTVSARPLSALLFNLFFAAIGAGANMSLLISTGPAVLGLMTVAVSVHLSTSLVGIRIWNAVVGLKGSGKGGVDADELVIASNANIGGPATAASMAASIGRTDLVLPATVTGTFGYATATLLGLSIYRILCR